MLNVNINFKEVELLRYHLSLRSWRFCGRSMNIKAAVLVFAAPLLKLKQNRQLRRLVSTL